MIEKIARRAGGFASTTAFNWLAGARDAGVMPAPPVHPTRRKPVVAGAVALAAAALSTKRVRTTAENALRGLADTIRTDNGTTNGNGSVGDLTEKTRAELYELAKKAGVAGRSGMSKEQLTRALSG